MTLEINGDISEYYAETLALLFFPGSKFPKDGTGGFPLLSVELSEKDGEYIGKATFTDGERTESAQYSPAADTVSRQNAYMIKQIAVGGAVLEAGEKFCGFRPPWGILTGVRPAKIAVKAIERGETPEEIIPEDFFTSPEKAKIAAITARAEMKFITDEMRKRCSVYIAIPFCPTRCAYCSFVSYSSPRILSMIPAYLERLFVDIENTFRIINELGLTVETVYIGGGTPTTLSETELYSLLRKIGECTDVKKLSEFTLEAGRPDTITEEKMRIAREMGVTRVSVNAQTMNADILSAIGRKHTPEDFLRAFSDAEKSGIRDINVDLIAGLPGESAESFSSSVDKIISLDPSNITVHTFYVKRAATLTGEDPQVCRAVDGETVEAVSAAGKKLLSAGYMPYYLYRQKNTAANLENTGFAKIGHEGLYNIYMMEEVHSVFGAGASSMTKLVSPSKDDMKIVRISETKYPYEYLDPEKSSAEKRYRDLKKACFDFYGKQ